MSANRYVVGSWTEPRIRALAAFRFNAQAWVSNETVVDLDGPGLVYWQTAAWLVDHGYACPGTSADHLHLTSSGASALMGHEIAGRLEPYGVPRLDEATLEPS